MIDIGEDLVGAYLREVIGCPVVQFNVRTGTAQGEIDVVGLKMQGAQISEAWLVRYPRTLVDWGDTRATRRARSATRSRALRHMQTPPTQAFLATSRSGRPRSPQA